jgi:hypothetical protein
VIEHWRKRVAEIEKQYYIPEDYNRGRPRNKSIDPERTKTWQHLLTYDERKTIIKHPQLHPKGGKQKNYLRVRSQGRLWSDQVRFKEMTPLTIEEVGKQIEGKFGIKLVDMGNGCYIDK